MKSARTFRWANYSIIACTTSWMAYAVAYAFTERGWTFYTPYTVETPDPWWIDRLYLLVMLLTITTGILVTFHLRALQLDLHSLGKPESASEHVD